MSAETTIAFVESLPVADESFANIGVVDIVDERDKAILIAVDYPFVGERQQWLPKRVCGRIPGSGAFGATLAVKRWFLSQNRLWWLTK